MERAVKNGESFFSKNPYGVNDIQVDMAPKIKLKKPDRFIQLQPKDVHTNSQMGDQSMWQGNEKSFMMSNYHGNTSFASIRKNKPAKVYKEITETPD